MSRHITRTYLQTRYWLATLSILGVLGLTVGIGILQMNSLKNNARYSVAFVKLTEKSNNVEGALLQLAISQDAFASSHVDSAEPAKKNELRQAIIALAEVFTALRMSDPDADDVEGNEAERDENEIAEVLELDKAELEQRYGLASRGMPFEMVRLWESEEEDEAPTDGVQADETAEEELLEDNIGTFLQMAMHVEQKLDETGRIDTALIYRANAHFKTEIQPALGELTLAIRASADRNAFTAFLMLLIGGGICATAVLGVAVFVFRPMVGTIIDAHTKLVAERDRAISSDQAKKDFLAVMSHELRTPMNGVLGFASLALRTDLTPTQRDYIETIQNSGQSLLDLLNAILDLSKIEAGSLEVEPHTFSLNDTVDSVIQLMAAQAFEKRLDITLFVDAEIPKDLCGDSGLIRKLLLNLVGNAIKFTETGGVAVEVRKTIKDPEPQDDSVLIEFRVSDTGIGIPREKWDLIFDRFAQADASTRRLHEGTGLGLAICKEIAQAMDGSVWVESETGVGSTFHARLLLENAEPMAPSLREFNGHDLSRARVLVVDDNALNCRIAALQLSAYGARNQTVQTCEAALAELAAAFSAGDPYHICVIDQMMPVTDGIELLNMIRTNEKHASLKTILSSSAGIRTDSDAQALGFDAAVPKPVNQDRLIQSIANLLEERNDQDHEALLDAAFEQAMPVKTPVEIEKTAHVLVVEDNIANLKLASLLLKDSGYTMDTAVNGVEAVQAATRFKYQAILMDIRMPVMDGLEATRRIRQIPGPRGSVPIVAMTADIAEFDEAEFQKAGMQAVIPKPIDDARMLSVLASLVSKRTDSAA